MKEDRAKKLVETALSDLQTQLEAGRSETLLRFLDCVSRFHQYSWLNCVLIGAQRPGATRVAGFRKWLELNRSVRKGEKGIAILAPMTYRKQTQQEDDTEKATVIRGFKVVHVFDVSQTEGDDLPEFAGVKGEPRELLDDLECLVRDSQIELRYEPLPLGVKGYSARQTIVLSEGLEPAERFSVLAHELAHAWMHDAERRKQASKTVKETEAEAVSYAVCRAVGFDCTTHSSDYIQLYNGDVDVLTLSLGLIQQMAARMITGLTEMSSRSTHQKAEAPQLAC
ncbi:MAG: ImmA/IrrE family metallo-endopeptidase [Planctomycetota bacterium]|nr:MAG: ImmA/IrrE family metallo-endopeptidase [Planctomycetota bacterium]